MLSFGYSGMLSYVFTVVGDIDGSKSGVGRREERRGEGGASDARS
jgi:hypothetical protein